MSEVNAQASWCEHAHHYDIAISEEDANGLLAALKAGNNFTFTYAGVKITFYRAEAHWTTKNES